MPVQDVKPGRFRSALSSAGTALKEALKVPAVEAAVGGAAGALILRSLSSFGLDALDARYVDPMQRARIKRAATILGAIAGGANPFIRDADYSSVPSFFSSMSQKASSDSFDMTPFLGTIDVAHATGVLNEDAFLHPYEKQTAISVVRQAPLVTPGTTSQYNLTRAAIRAGVSFVPAYSFGMLAGKALGLPPDIVQNMSRMGALAYAVRASGLADQL